MNLEAPLTTAAVADTALQHHSMLGDFGSGLGSHLKAPLVGVGQLPAGKSFDQSTKDKAPVPESKARMAGEMVADAVIFLGATAILKQVPAIGTLAPIAAGGVLGLLEPLKNGEGLDQRLVPAAVGAGTMVMIDQGPKFLAATGLIKSAETSVVGAFACGAIIGGATEQVNIILAPGIWQHLARQPPEH